MKRFVEELIRPLLEQEMVTAVYGGGFKPPTKGHFDLVKQALKDYPEIDKFIIYVGGGVRDGITQEQSLKIWETYKELLPGKKIEIIPSAQPIGDVRRYAKDHPDETVYFTIGYREGREDDLMDIASRTKGVEEKYPNLKVKVIQTPAGDMSGTNARKALRNNNPEKFFTYLPEDVPQSEKQEIYDLLQPTVTESNPQSGKAAPYGSGYREVNEGAMPSLYENLKTLIPQLTNHMYQQGMEIKPFPKVVFIHDDAENAQNILGKTAYYNPNNYTIVLYTMGRHPKDILRSFAHEMIHHEQNMRGTLGDIQTTNTTEDDHLDRIEREAYEKGNIMFRNWTDSLKENQVNENALANIIAKIAAPLVGLIISRAIDGLFGYIDDIKRKILL
jgi:hypothetical protein